MATIQFVPLVTVATPPLAPAARLPDAPFPGPAQSMPQADADGLPLPASTPIPAGNLPANLNDSAAMRPDQVLMARQLGWPVFDGATMASAWRTMVVTYGAQLAAQQQQASGQHVPGALLIAGHYSGAAPAGQQAPLLWHPEAWRFVTHGAAGRQLALRVLEGEADRPPARRRRAKAALRLELSLADGSTAMVQLAPLGDGVTMDLATDQPQSVEQLRQALPELKEAIERTGLTLLRVTLRAALGPGRPLQNYTPQLAVSLSPPLFRAMAEVALLLSAPRAPAG